MKTFKASILSVAATSLLFANVSFAAEEIPNVDSNTYTAPSAVLSEPLPSDSGLSAQAANYAYNFTIKTQERENAGTDSKISITFYGSNGTYLTQSFPGTFEQGDIDTMRLMLPNMGKITKITLRSDGSGYKPGWRPEYVTIDGPSGTSKFTNFTRSIGAGGADAYTTTN
ncbi:hypothetical protein L2089_09080 [Paenibacillus hunanensis]|uniref:PLAT/LH2 domain-containing protein n=1 Tax=Paenibacillus hunanensis TaxID=539262 RepID=UPI002025F3FC|nr:PLAT/LH2 domain-containing protein [Paenibacillus hunanensis]MCL9660833.1 hypothetical protein [Paenibacillus hunanensis]